MYHMSILLLLIWEFRIYGESSRCVLWTFQKAAICYQSFLIVISFSRKTSSCSCLVMLWLDVLVFFFLFLCQIYLTQSYLLLFISFIQVALHYILYSVSYGNLCHCGNFSNEFFLLINLQVFSSQLTFSFIYLHPNFCNEILSWMIEIWMKNRLGSDNNCNTCKSRMPQNI